MKLDENTTEKKERVQTRIDDMEKELAGLRKTNYFHQRMRMRALRYLIKAAKQSLDS